jgi:hypothetical protein
MKNFISAIILLFSCMTNINGQTLPSYLPTSGLVGWWPFNGNAIDESGNGLNGLVNGATLTTDRNGLANKAYSFDGIDDHISVNRIYQSSFSFSGWYFISQNQPYIPIVDAFDSHWELLLENLKPAFVRWISSPSTYSMLNTLPTSNTFQWYHVACTYSGSQLSIYLNGNLLQSFSSISLFNNVSGTYYFGKSPSGGLQILDGKLDDFGIWNRALTPCEIKKLYKSGTGVSISSASSSICLGESVLLTASGATNYLWGNGVITSTISVSPNVSTIYSVSTTYSLGCTETTTLNILVNPTPLITANSGMICTGESYTITPSGASTYTYSSGSAVVSPTLTTTYSVTGTNTLGCVSQSPTTLTVFVSPCTGIDELDNNQSIIFYPNPFTNEIYLKVEGEIKNKKYLIYTASGQLIQSGILNDNKINCSDFSKGLYFIKIEGSAKAFKLVKEN